MTEAPAVALLVSSERGRLALQQTVSSFGYRVVFDTAPVGVDVAELTGIVADLWLLDMADESVLVDWLLEHSSVPVVMGSGEDRKSVV